MDNFLLEAVVREAAVGLAGCHLAAVREIPPGGLLLIFESPSPAALLTPASPPGASSSHATPSTAPAMGSVPSPDAERSRPWGPPMRALVLDAGAGRQRLHLAAETVPTLRSAPRGFAATLAHRLRGSVLSEIVKEPSERVVDLRFGRAGSLVAELIGKGSNLLLLDAGGTIVSFDRNLRSELRRAEAGKPYEPPPRSRRAAERPTHGEPSGVFDAPPERVRAIADRAEAESQPLATALVEELIGLPAVVAEDIERMVRRGEDPFAALVRWLQALRSGELCPTLYSRGPLHALPFDRVPSPDALFALPLELAFPPAGLVATRFARANGAAEEFFRIRGRAQDFVRRREGLAAILRHEAIKLDRLRVHLEDDLGRLEPPGASRRHAEALLAGLSRARREGEHVFVPDPYAEGGAEQEVCVKIDPALSIQSNASALFRREAKAERARKTIPARLGSSAARRAEVEKLSATLAAGADASALEAAEVGLARLGLVLAPEPALRRARQRIGRATGSPERAVSPAAPRLAGIRTYRSSEGFEILVGKTGRENERLTFHIAGPEDFWLHAAGVPGAHVVVRNPRRLAALPARTLREAAAIAAFFSRAAGHAAGRPEIPGRRPAGKVEVHVARRKHVRKARGEPPGTVMVRRFTSVSVEPAEPPRDLET